MRRTVSLCAFVLATLPFAEVNASTVTIGINGSDDGEIFDGRINFSDRGNTNLQISAPAFNSAWATQDVLIERLEQIVFDELCKIRLATRFDYRCSRNLSVT